jgi:hypothetical protein
MWGDQETGAMEYYSESANTEPKLIDFFKCEAPLREDHGGVGEQTYGNPRLGGAGNGASQTLPAIADGGRTMKREPPSGIFVDFLGRNGDHQVAVSSRYIFPAWVSFFGCGLRTVSCSRTCCLCQHSYVQTEMDHSWSGSVVADIAGNFLPDRH